jgi:hypothetical protein
MTPAEAVLPRLECVRETGHQHGVTRCPAHDDKNPSLAWRIVDDGTLLVKCWAGCTTHDIVDAIGLKLRDLFAQPHVDRRRLVDDRIDYRQALAILRREAMVLLVATSDITKGIVLSAPDIERIQTAAGRIRDVVDSAKVRVDE